MGDMMKIYLEIIFIINFLLDFMILYGTKKILKINKSIWRILLGGGIGSLTTFLLLIDINSWELFFIKIVMSFLIILVAFGKKNLLHNLSYFYLISIILGGCIYLLDLNSNYYFNYLILIVGSLIIITLLVKEFINYRNVYVNKYEVSIYIKNKLYKLEGFIDTGNRLFTPIKKEPVILVNLKIKPKEVIYVPFKALNNSGIISCIRPDKVVIADKEFKKCLVGLAKDKFNLNGLDCILPNQFKEEL